MAGARSCLICNGDEGKYKCPRCKLYTCSLPCFREHRDAHPAVESSPTPQSNDTSFTLANDFSSSVSSQDASHTEESSTQPGTFKRSQIADMPEYKTLIQRYPNLERLLWNIAAATDPPTSNGGSNGDHNPLPGSNRGHRKAGQSWTKDIGYENGVEVLRRTRETPGDDRDAIKEYCELVQLYSARRESANAAAYIRQQLAQDDAKAIGDLIRAEKSDV